MNRRGALATIGGILLAPSLLIRPAKRKHLDLSRFCCDVEGLRFDMTKPFQQDDWTYATDGRVCVRVRPETADKVIEREKLPPANTLPWEEHGKWIDWKPRICMVDDGWCVECDRSGWLGELEECDRCYGSGYDQYEKCGKCFGLGHFGEKLCPVCNGKPCGSFPCVAKVGDVLVDAKYQRLIEELPGLRYQFTTVDTPTASIFPTIRLQWDGGDGLLMPLDNRQAEWKVRG